MVATTAETFRLFDVVALNEVHAHIAQAVEALLVFDLLGFLGCWFPASGTGICP